MPIFKYPNALIGPFSVQVSKLYSNDVSYKVANYKEFKAVFIFSY